MLRRVQILLYTEVPLHEFKGVVLANVKAKALKAPKPPPVVVVDVREPHELVDDGHIPGAVNIPLKHLEEDLLDHFKPDSHSIVFCCRSGRRSMTAIDIAEGHGFRASHYKGGNQGYQKDPVTDKDIAQFLKESEG